MYAGWIDDLMGVGKTLLTGTPQVSSALNTVRANVGKFLGLPLRFDRALRIIGSKPKTTKWNALDQGVRLLQSKYDPLEARLTTVLAKKDQGLSLALLTEAVPVATQVKGMLAAMSKLESEIGTPTAEAPSRVREFAGWLPLIGVTLAGLWWVMRR